jgi:hypothetical protein
MPRFLLDLFVKGENVKQTNADSPSAWRGNEMVPSATGNVPTCKSSRIGTASYDYVSKLDSHTSDDEKCKLGKVESNGKSDTKEEEKSDKRAEENGGVGDGDVFEAAALEAISAQPTGFTLSTTQV